MKYYVAIIGAGPAGIEAAKLCAKHKLKTVLIEEKNIGGVCLNQGCIPTKFYLNNYKKEADFSALYKKKNELVDRIKKNLVSYLKSQNIDVINSEAQLRGRNAIHTDKGLVEADYIIVATGSRPFLLPGINSDNITTPEGFLDSGVLYDKYLIVGAGAIGTEFSFLLTSMGKEVHLIEKESRILPFLDKEITTRAERLLKKEGVNINKNQDINNYDLKEFDQVIFCIGRKPNLGFLNEQSLGLPLDSKGNVITDDNLRTSIPNIYICGDAASRFFYAYTAEYEAKVCVNNILGKKVVPNYRGIPASIFTKPSISSCGLTEQEAKEQDYKFRIAKYTFRALSSSFVYNDTQGFVKLIFDEGERVLGAHIISNISHEIIGYFSLCIRNNWKKEVLEQLILVHPTISEFVTKI